MGATRAPAGPSDILRGAARTPGEVERRDRAELRRGFAEALVDGTLGPLR